MSDAAEVVSYIALAIAIGGMIIGIFNHKKLTSRCGKREPVIISLDIDSTARTSPKPSVAI